MRPMHRPQLLVSVTGVDEANAALQGGADIIDVKDPHVGSLGMAPVDAIQAVSSRITTIPVSAALGELIECNVGETDTPFLAGVEFAKLGLSGCGSRDNWINLWQRTRSRIEVEYGFHRRWIAVAYADAGRASAPSVSSIARAAAATGCAGVLVDTFVKDGRSMLEFLSVDELIALRRGLQSGGMLLALAGNLRAENLALLRDVKPDVIAVRSAACSQGQRTQSVETAAVAAFREKLCTLFEQRSQSNTLNCLSRQSGTIHT